MIIISIFSIMVQVAFAQMNFKQTNPNVTPSNPSIATPAVVQSSKTNTSTAPDLVEKSAPAAASPQSPKVVVAETSSFQEASSGMAHLRKRQHRLSWDYLSSKTTVEVEGRADEETDGGALVISYGYNFGYFEVGGGYGFTLTDDGTETSNAGTITLYGRLNIIENKPGNDLIPFLALGIQAYREELDSTTNVEASGNGGAFQVGLSWFPLGEIYAVEVAFLFFKLF